MIAPPRPYTECSADALPWHTFFIGMPMQHNYWLYAIIDRVMAENPQLQSIIEIGTGGGAVSTVFGLWGVRRGIPVLTVDHVMRHHRGILETLGVHYIQADEMSEEVQNQIAFVLQRGPTWLFCDGGHKTKELQFYAERLPKDSIISAHDLGTEFRHEIGAAPLCPHILQPYREEWWMEMNIQLALYKRQ